MSSDFRFLLKSYWDVSIGDIIHHFSNSIDKIVTAMCDDRGDLSIGKKSSNGFQNWEIFKAFDTLRLRASHSQ